MKKTRNGARYEDWTHNFNLEGWRVTVTLIVHMMRRTSLLIMLAPYFIANFHGISQNKSRGVQFQSRGYSVEFHWCCIAIVLPTFNACSPAFWSFENYFSTLNLRWPMGAEVGYAPTFFWVWTKRLYYLSTLQYVSGERWALYFRPLKTCGP